MATFYWRGSTGSFNLPSGWLIADATGTLSPAGRAPGGADIVVLDTTGMTLSADTSLAAELRLDLPLAAGALNLNGDTLSLLDTAQLGGAGSRISGPGTLETNGVSAVPAPQAGGSALQFVAGATWANAGLVYDAGVVEIGDSATLRNEAGALFAFATDQPGQVTATGNGSVLNDGTLAKTGGSGVSTVTAPVTNTGEVTANSGTLELNGGGVLGGRIGGDAGEVRLAGTWDLASGDTQSVSFGDGAHLGSGADGAAVLLGPGTLASTGTVRLTAWSAPQVALAGGATWQNAGTVIAAADLAFGAAPGDSGTLVNQAGASFSFAGDVGLGAQLPSGGADRMVNAGTLSKTGGSGTSRIAVPVEDTGSIVVNSGTLSIDAGSTLGGSVSGSGVLAFNGGVSTLDPGGVIATGGLLIDGATLVQRGAVTLTGTARVGGGTLDLSGGSLAASGLAIAGGGTVQGQGTLASAIHDAGLLQATAGTLTVAGILDGTGQVQVDPGAALLFGGATAGLGGVTLRNSGTLLTAGGGSATVSSDIGGADGTVLIAGNSSLTIDAAVGTAQAIVFGGTGATLTVADVLDFAPAAIDGFGPGDTLRITDTAAHVAARLTMLEGLASAGKLTAISFTNSGTPDLVMTNAQMTADLDVLAKIVSPYRVAAETDWVGPSGAFADPSQWSGGGVPDAAATAVIDSAARPTVTHANGSDTLHSLTNRAGRFVLSGGTLQLAQLDNRDSIAWNGGTLVLVGGPDAAGLQNEAGAVLAIAAAGQTLSATNGGSIDNAGTIRVDGAAGNAALVAPLVNTGQIIVSQGTLSLDAGGSSAAEGMRVDTNGTLAFGGGRFAVTGGGYDVRNTDITGGTLDASAAEYGAFHALALSGGAAVLGRTAAGADRPLQQTGGTLSGSGVLTAYAGARLTGGVQSGPGLTRLLGRSEIGGFALDGGRVLRNDGALTWSGGDIVLGGGDGAAPVQAGTLVNAGVMRITADAVIGPAPGGSGVLQNAGVLAVSAGTGQVDIDAELRNQGVIQVSSGVLSLNGGGSSAGGPLLVNDAATLRFGTPVHGGAGGAFHISGGYRVGNTQVDGGTLDLSGATGARFTRAVSLADRGVLTLGAAPATAKGFSQGGEALLTGGGTLVVTGSAQLVGAVQSGPGTTVLRGASSIGGALQLDGGRVLENDGTLVWNSGSIALGGGDAAAPVHAGTLVNAAGGAWRIETDGTIAAPGHGVVVNAGTLAKTAGTGDAVIAAGVTNDGTVLAQSGTLTLDQAVEGSGTFRIDAGAKLDFGSTVGGGESIGFLGSGGTLAVEMGGTFAAPVSGFAAGDALDLAAVGFSADLSFGFVADAGGGTLTVDDGAHSVMMSLLGSYAPAGFVLSGDGHGGVLVGYS